MSPDPALQLDGRTLAGWEQLAAGAGFRGADPPAAFGFQQGIAPALPDGSYVVAPQYLLGPAGDDGLWLSNAMAQVANFTGFNLGGHVRLMPLNYNIGSVIQLQPHIRLSGVTALGSGPGITTLLVNPGANLPAVIASAGWQASANTQSQAPVHVDHLAIDANNSAGIGIVSQNFESQWEKLLIQNTTGDGLRFDFFGANGSTGINNTMVENRVDRCEFRQIGGIAIRTTDPSSTSAITDGFIRDCIISGATVQGIDISASGGWNVEGNHLYGCPCVGQAILECDRPFGTRIAFNRIENLGQPATSAFYSGIQIGNCQQVNGATIEGNCITGGVTGNAGSTLRFIDMDVANGLTAGAVMVANILTYAGALVGTVNGIVTNNGNASSVTDIGTSTNLVAGNFSNPTQFNANGGTVNHNTAIFV